MGVDANNYTILGNAATVASPYLRIRDLRCDKLGSSYQYNYRLEIVVNTQVIHQEHKIFTDTTPGDKSLWTLCYDNLKIDLTKNSITYTDKI